MLSKLTLSVDAQVVARAKRHARRQGTSLSRLVERMLDAADVAFREPVPILRFAVGLDESIGGRVRGVARARKVVLADQHRVDDELGSRITHIGSMPFRTEAHLTCVNRESRRDAR